MQPGWYQDPQNPALIRWWDGNAWTAHTQATPTAAPQPSQPQQSWPPQGATQQSAAQPSWQQPVQAQPAWQRAPQSPEPRGSGSLWKAAAAVGVVVVLGVAGLVISRSDSGKNNGSLSAACTELSAELDRMSAESASLSEAMFDTSADWTKARDITVSYLGETLPSAFSSLSDIATAVAADSSVSRSLKAEASKLAADIKATTGKLKDGVSTLKAASSEAEFQQALTALSATLDSVSSDISDEFSAYLAGNEACTSLDAKLSNF